VNEPLDWQRVLNLALHHDVAPLLQHALRTMPLPSAVPAAALTELHRARAANALRSALLYDELAGVLAWAHRQHIDIIVMKGAALAEMVYGDRTLRPMRDVDLLVRPEHLEAVEAFLTARGYTLDAERARAREWYRRHDYHVAYYKRSAGLPTLCIEPHWHLDLPSRPFRIDLEGIWTRAVPAVVAGVEAKTLSPEDALLHLCLHACKHKLTASLRSYCDIAAVVHRHAAQMDWTRVADRAWDWQVNTFVYVPLAVARDLLEAPVPAPVLDRLVPASFERGLVSLAQEGLAEDPLGASLFTDFFDLRWGDPLARRRVVAKVLSREVLTARYGVRAGAQHVWWRYSQRLAHLCRCYAPAFWQFLRQGRRSVAQARRRSQLLRFLQPFDSPQRPNTTASWSKTEGAVAGQR
jgi:hypothetical protein